MIDAHLDHGNSTRNGGALPAVRILAFALATLPALVRGADTIVLHEGKPITGKVIDTKADEVVIDTDPIKKTVPVYDIQYIAFDGEPAEFKQARASLASGQLDAAETALEKVDAASVDRDEIKAELQYFQAAVAARKAIGGSGPKPAAGKLLLEFEKTHKTSYRYLSVSELLGDLLVSMGRFEQAGPYYKNLAAVKSETYQMRASLLVGRAQQAAGNHDKALASFEEVLAKKGEGKEAAQQRMEATLGKAVSLAGKKQAAEGIKLVQTVIKSAPEENLELHARAYNSLGNCYLAAGDDKQALIAFLHVDLLFAGFAEQHAEALYHLASLWPKSEKAERGKLALDQLKQRYPGSRWASK